MTVETETGFGSGLRAQLERKQAPEPAPEPDPAELTDSEDALAVVEQLYESVPEEEEGTPELRELRTELEAALEREQQLRDALQHQVEAYERELASGRDLALREAEFGQRIGRLEAAQAELEESQVVMRIQVDQVDSERAAVAAMRAELVAEEARLAELANHVDARALELESAHQERAQASAHLAQQLAGIAERERELKRERSALDSRRQEAEARIAAREQNVRELDAAALRRERTVGERELALQAAAAEQDRERMRLQERAEAVAARDEALEKRNTARERMLENGEASLVAREKRVREQGELLERERAGHGRASQDAFALLAELEQREARVQARESVAQEKETLVAERTRALEQTEEELRVREAGLGADLELRE
ncbi:MAG TPA: hypothetical protein VJ986_13870, partial [Gaiellaceae bacterium]|nr:hypothetical protein [Gaiellaceae bacterium]